MQPLKYFVPGLMVCSLAGAMAAPAFAAPIRYEFSGVFRYPITEAGGPVHQGDTYQGTLFYDPERAIVAYALDGFRWYLSPGDAAGLEVKVSTASGIYTFADQPGYIGINVYNDFRWAPSDPGLDQLYVNCAEYTRFPDFYRRRYVGMYFSIFTYDTSLLDSTELPRRLTIPRDSYSAIAIFGGPSFQQYDYYLYAPIDRIALANRAPDCSAAAGRIPAFTAVNGAWAPVTIDGVTDPDGDPVTLTVTGVTQDEPVIGPGTGPTCPDATISAGSAQVRLERSGTGNGRVYRVSFTASDGRGGTSPGSVTVCVPHDQGATTCVDDGTTYDSTQPCPNAPILSAAANGTPELAVAATGGRGRVFNFTLPVAGEVSLTVHDVAGRTVENVTRAWYGAGAHRLEWNAAGRAPGIYFARLRAGETLVVRRFAIL